MGWVFTDEMRFYLHEGETLLDGMLRTGHQDVRYMCRQGYCGNCRMTIKAKTGSLSYKLTPLAQLGEDEVLACCCVSDGTLVACYENQTSLFDEFVKKR